MPPVLCITGMHRSGTSLTAAWLQRCGLQIDDGRLGPANKTNPRGHFEDVDFYFLEEDALKVIDPQSKGWIIFPDTFLGLPEASQVKARELVEIRNRKYPVWGWKDPRSVMFLTDWKNLMPSLMVFLLWRPCAEVVASLMKRARIAGEGAMVKLSITDAVRLWLHYNARVCDYKRMYPQDTVLLPLEYLLTQDKAALELLNDRLGVGLRYEPLGQLFEKDLLERQPGLQAQVMSAYPEVAEMEAKLSELSDVPVNRQARKPGHPLAGVFADATATHLYLVEQERKIDTLEKVAGDLRGQVKAGETKFQESEERRREAEDRSQKSEDRIKEQEARLQEAEGGKQEAEDRSLKSEVRIRELSDTIAARDGQIAAQAQTITERDGQIATQTRTINERDGLIATQTQIINEREGRIDQYSQALKGRELEVSQLSEKIAWQVERIKFLEGHLDRIHNHPLMRAYRWVKRFGRPEPKE